METATKISSNEQYLDAQKPVLSKRAIFRQVASECGRQHMEDVRGRAMSICQLVKARAEKGSSICQLAHGFEDKWERLCHDQPVFDREMSTASCTLLSYFFALPADEQRRILGGWQPAIERVSRADHDDWWRGTIDRVLEIEAGGNDSVQACQCSENNQSRGAGVYLAVTEGVTQEEAVKGLRVMLKMVEDSWPELMTMRPDSLDVMKVKYKSGPLASNKPHKLGGKGDEAGEEQTAGSESYDGLYA